VRQSIPTNARPARAQNYELAALTAEHCAVINGLRRQITGELEAVVPAGQLDGSFYVADVRMTPAHCCLLALTYPAGTGTPVTSRDDPAVCRQSFIRSSTSSVCRSIEAPWTTSPVSGSKAGNPET
jgi:hypothetical protein